MADETRTADQLAQDYLAMGHSVDLINGVIDGSQWKMNLMQKKKIL